MVVAVVLHLVGIALQQVLLHMQASWAQHLLEELLEILGLEQLQLQEPLLWGGNGGISTYCGGGGASYTTNVNFSGTSTVGTKIASGTSGSSNNTAVPGNSDANYISGIGIGGSYNPTVGGNGLIVITYTLPACVVPTSLAASATATVTGAGVISGNFSVATTPPYGYVVVRSTSNTLPTLSTGTTYTVGSNT